MGQLGDTFASLHDTPGVSFLGRTSTLKIRVGTARVQTAFGTSTMPDTRPSDGAHDSKR